MELYLLDAISLVEEIGLGSRINMIIQTAGFLGLDGSPLFSKMKKLGIRPSPY